MEMDEDEDGFCKYGTPLKPYEEDEIPSKRPVTVEDQIVRDENGKRRFHGAFTGGFSAGYWNTVGSKEGWTPQQFKSSRSEKAASLPKQSANDFMDEEDLGEFGIAHQRIQTQLDFGEARSGKRKFEVASKGPIPGKPVLQTLLAPTHDKAAARILKTMGWKDGQGIGARLTKREKRRAQERNEKEISGMRRYGCDLGPVGESRDPESSDSDLSDYDITFAPDDFDPFVITPKDNSFGLGYSGLQRAPVLQQSLGIFDALEVVDRKSNKKLSIRGQAFGVGALEEEDDDIYARDDMTRYDFALEDAKKAPILAIKAAPDSKVIEKFQKAKESRKAFLRIFRVDIPRNFRPRNWLIKRSRFDPLAPEVAKKLEEEQKYKKMGLGRHDLRPEERGALLGDKPSTSRDDKSREKFKVLEEKSEIPESKIPEEKSKETTKSEAEVLRKNAEQITRKLMKEKDGVFRPFAMDEEKQARYEKFLNFVETPNIKMDDFFFDLQPPSMSEWDRERERKEFMHAKRLYKPLSGLMSDRFVSAGGNSHFEASPIVAEPEKPAQKEIKMRRSKGLWKPHKDLCKRFNVPEPFGGLLVEQKPEKKSKFSVFDYIEIPTNSKTNFARPVLLPSVKKKPVKPPTPVSAKEFFNEEPQRPSIPFAKVEEEPKVEEKPKVVPRVIEPKTELEKKVEEALDKPPQEKKDLFRSIFCDSSDEEDKENPPEAPKQISDSEKLKLVESFVATKSASEFNILRNESPPKGIFKNILEVTRSLPERVQSSSSSSENEEEMAYGPALPQNVPSEDNSKLDEKLERYLKKSSSLEVASRWVEKDKVERKKKKKEKKKHHKHKHKSHKKKDKRK